jgi:hypothetical protein
MLARSYFKKVLAQFLTVVEGLLKVDSKVQLLHVRE